MATRYGDLEFDRLGHGSVRITTEDGVVCYVDLWGEAVDATALAPADVVFVTHGDRAHYDPDAIAAVSTSETVLVTFDIDTAPLADAIGEIVVLEAGDSASVGDIEVEAFPAHNDPDGPRLDADGVPFHEPGDGIGYRLTIDGTTIYAPGDTDYVDELRSVTADVFLPPIGGTYTMDRVEAAEFAQSVGADLVLPTHYNTDNLTGVETEPEAFKADVEVHGGRVVLLDEDTA